MDKNLIEMKEVLIDLTLLAMDIADEKGCAEFTGAVVCDICGTGISFPTESDIDHMDMMTLAIAVEELDAFIDRLENDHYMIELIQDKEEL